MMPNYPKTFEEWWTQETVYRFGAFRIKRQDLVLHAANKDGGAHVDEKLAPELFF